MSDEGKTDPAAFISKELESSLSWSWKGQKWWSFANHGATVCIIVFSAVVAVLTQLKHDAAVPYLSMNVTTLTTILSLCVTILSTVQLKLGFERKWIANRMTHSALYQLLIDEKTGTDVQAVKTALKSVLDRHDKAITASPAPAPEPKP